MSSNQPPVSSTNAFFADLSSLYREVNSDLRAITVATEALPQRGTPRRALPASGKKRCETTAIVRQIKSTIGELDEEADQMTHFLSHSSANLVNLCEKVFAENEKAIDQMEDHMAKLGHKKRDRKALYNYNPENPVDTKLMVRFDESLISPRTKARKQMVDASVSTHPSALPDNATMAGAARSGTPLTLDDCGGLSEYALNVLKNVSQSSCKKPLYKPSPSPFERVISTNRGSASYNVSMANESFQLDSQLTKNSFADTSSLVNQSQNSNWNLAGCSSSSSSSSALLNEQNVSSMDGGHGGGEGGDESVILLPRALFTTNDSLIDDDHKTLNSDPDHVTTPNRRQSQGRATAMISPISESELVSLPPWLRPMINRKVLNEQIVIINKILANGELHKIETGSDGKIRVDKQELMQKAIGHMSKRDVSKAEVLLKNLNRIATDGALLVIL